MTSKLDDLKVTVNYRVWPQHFLKDMHAAGFNTPFDYICSFAGPTPLERMSQKELGDELGRLSVFKDGLRSERAKELVTKYPSQWKNATISEPARAFAIDVIKQLRNIEARS